MFPKYLRDLLILLIGLIILFHAMGYIVRLDSTVLVVVGLLILAHGVFGLLHLRVGHRR